LDGGSNEESPLEGGIQIVPSQPISGWKGDPGCESAVGEALKAKVNSLLIVRAKKVLSHTLYTVHS